MDINKTHLKLSSAGSNYSLKKRLKARLKASTFSKTKSIYLLLLLSTKYFFLHKDYKL